MIISGHLMELGVMNGNGWGISEAGAGDILSSLVGVPLKICQDHSHGCDYHKTKPGAQIGKIISAIRNENKISISAEVNSMASLNINTGKYPRSWSIFTGYREKDSAGYLSGAKAIAVSLVDSPAYPGAGYSIAPDMRAAASIEPQSELDTFYLKKWQSPKIEQKSTTLNRALEKFGKKYQGK